MTIDEAIVHAKEVAEKQRRYSAEWLSKSNEEGSLEEDFSKVCEQFAEEREQIAKWLEELKELRSMVKCSAFIDGYNKSINDCAALISKIPWMCGYSCPIECCYGTEQSCKESWRTYLIEQLKGDREDAGIILEDH